MYLKLKLFSDDTLRGMNTKMELFFLLLVFVIKHQT